MQSPIFPPSPEDANTPLRPSSADFPRLAVREKQNGSRTVRESETVLGETVMRKTEEYIDEATGERKVRTVEVVEKLIEREVETLQEKILSLELTKSDETDDVEKEDSSKEVTVFDDENSASEPPTPTTDDTPIISVVNDGGTPQKKKRRKKSKKGKH